ncbi:unnamed protein product [Pleuronectes platessa]|uniref:Uncharacterized protein n=1 Tax=Pleuronectes platessa TaxID=8262 RepID=A0A9N7W1V7_PLEPL|nr:unnamed protein product [Pleuronectes platessa]
MNDPRVKSEELAMELQAGDNNNKSSALFRREVETGSDVLTPLWRAPPQRVWEPIQPVLQKSLSSTLDSQLEGWGPYAMHYLEVTGFVLAERAARCPQMAFGLLLAAESSKV